jgi:two-component system response regulator AtoC
MLTTNPPDVAKEGESLVSSNGACLFVPAVSAAMRQIERTATDIAATDLPVLIMGESGTGKSVLALRIHHLSQRTKEAFVRMNCAAVTPKLFEKGIDDNWSNWPGAGTLFLDEIADLELSCQKKLLNAMPDGDTPGPDHKVKVRVIAATRSNLQKEVGAGHFREDLYYRISGICLRLPLLRQRKEDIQALTDCFLSKYAALLNKRKPQLSSRTISRFLEHSWPGNIRELEYTVQKIVALGDEQLALEDLSAVHAPAPSSGTRGGLSLKQAARTASRQAERDLILKVLAQTRWNRKLAARQLQISYKALLYKLKQIGVDSTESQ